MKRKWTVIVRDGAKEVERRTVFAKDHAEAIAVVRTPFDWPDLKYIAFDESKGIEPSGTGL
jgi:hypothetical protein